jgi:hypothetical protein
VYDEGAGSPATAYVEDSSRFLDRFPAPLLVANRGTDRLVSAFRRR